LAKIGDFLIKLSDDPMLLSEFDKDREQVMKDNGLLKNQRDIVGSNNLKRIRKALERENPGKAVFLALVRPIH
jgi:hypothetical protein